MKPDRSTVCLSGIDEERFGIRIARASGVTLDLLPSIMSFCRSNEVVMLIARCLASELSAAQAMEQAGFRLMDTLVYYARDVAKTPIPDDVPSVPVRPIQPGEEDEVQRVAADSFRDYGGHYHADPRLDRSKCDEAYASWAFRSCVSRDVADDVLVAVQDGRVVGFHAMRCQSAQEGQFVLGGVSPFARRRGIYLSIMTHGLQWGRSRGMERMIIPSQVTNIVAQRVWTRLGFEPTHAYYTFHKWFDSRTSSA